MEKGPDPTGNPPRGKKARGLDLFALTLALVSILIQGHQFGLGNQEFWLLGIRRALDLTWLVNDWFLSIPRDRQDLISILGVGALVFRESSLFLILHLVTRFSLLAGAWRLVDALLPGRQIVALLTMPGVLFLPGPDFWSIGLNAAQWEPVALGGALSLWFLADGMRPIDRPGKPVTLTLLGGGAMYFAPWIALPIVLAVLAHYLVTRENWKVVLLIGLGVFFLASPGWVPAIKHLFEEPGLLSRQDMVHALQFHQPSRYQPWTWSVGEVLQSLFLVLVTAIGWWKFLPAGRRGILVVPGILLGWVVGLGGIWFLEVIRGVNPIALFMEPFRMLFPAWIMAFALAAALLDSMEVKWKPAVVAGGWLILYVAWLAGGILGPTLIGLLILAMIFFVQHDGATPAMVPGWSRPACWIVLVVSLAGVIAMQTHGPSRERLMGDRWLVEAISTDPDRRDLMEWIGVNTPREAIFAIPPMMENFRLWEGRAIVVDYTQRPHTKHGLSQWVERMSLGTNALILTPGPELPESDVSAQQLVLLAQTYGARFVVVRGNLFHPTVVHRNRTYSVLDLERDQILFHHP